MRTRTNQPAPARQVSQVQAAQNNLEHPLLSLQRTIGNQAVSRLIQRVNAGDRIGAAFTSVPAGALKPKLRDNKFWGADFDVAATFNPDRIAGKTDQEFTTGEYRQYIRGYIKDTGRMVTHTLYNNQVLDPKKWNEDGNEKEPPYGHRFSKKASQWDRYKDEGVNGSSYTATDKPSYPVNIGDRVEVSFEFRGQLVKTDQKSNIVDPQPLASSEWSIKGWVEKNGKAKNPIITTGDL